MLLLPPSRRSILCCCLWVLQWNREAECPSFVTYRTSVVPHGQSRRNFHATPIPKKSAAKDWGRVLFDTHTTVGVLQASGSGGGGVALSNELPGMDCIDIDSRAREVILVDALDQVRNEQGHRGLFEAPFLSKGRETWLENPKVYLFVCPSANARRLRWSVCRSSGWCEIVGNDGPYLGYHVKWCKRREFPFNHRLSLIFHVPGTYIADLSMSPLPSPPRKKIGIFHVADQLCIPNPIVCLYTPLFRFCIVVRDPAYRPILIVHDFQFGIFCYIIVISLVIVELPHTSSRDLEMRVRVLARPRGDVANIPRGHLGATTPRPAANCIETYTTLLSLSM